MANDKSRASRHLAKRRRQRAGQGGRRSGRWRGRVLRLGTAAAGLLLVVTLVLVLPLRWLDPPTSSIMLQRALAARADDRPAPRHRWVDLAQISGNLQVAVIAAEDQKFLVHYGFDFDSIVDALRERTNRTRGASTISQQVVKNLYLWPGRSWLRKGLEAWLTLAIEALWPKQRILELYLNIAELGPDVFGAEAASLLHFGKSARRLSSRDAALLAAVLPSPARLSASRPSDYVEERAEKIAAEVRRMGGLAALRGL